MKAKWVGKNLQMSLSWMEAESLWRLLDGTIPDEKREEGWREMRKKIVHGMAESLIDLRSIFVCCPEKRLTQDEKELKRDLTEPR